MKKVYGVFHSYVDADVNFSDPVAYFENESDARAFTNKYYNPHIYDKPSDSCCGSLFVREFTVYESIEETPEHKWLSFDGFCADELVTVDDISKREEFWGEGNSIWGGKHT